MGDVVVVPAWVRWLVCQREWRGWHSKVSSVGDIGGNTRVVSQTVSRVVYYFSNSFQKLSGNEYCSKLEKQFRFPWFQVIYCTLQTRLTFQSFSWIFEFKVKLKLFPKQIQNSGIFRTRDVSRTLSIYPVKIQHIKITGTFKILVLSRTYGIFRISRIKFTQNS